MAPSNLWLFHKLEETFKRLGFSSKAVAKVTASSRIKSKLEAFFVGGMKNWMRYKKILLKLVRKKERKKEGIQSFRAYERKKERKKERKMCGRRKALKRELESERKEKKKEERKKD